MSSLQYTIYCCCFTAYVCSKKGGAHTREPILHGRNVEGGNGNTSGLGWKMFFQTQTLENFYIPNPIKF
jgi:hypothetical protein